MDESIRVSIIIPVYNVPEKALRDCLESTLHQTLKEIEVIVVDDGSTDRSGAICDEYAEKDKRVHVIHKTNDGLSAARNTGYESARGEWITFLDSDDWIEPTTCEETYTLGNETSVDVVIFGTVQEFEHHKNLFRYHFENGQVFRGEECKKLQCEILDFSGNIATAWAKLIRKNVLDENGIEHNAELRQGSEGIEFNIRLFEIITSAVFVNKVYYHYIYNSNSISAKHDERNHYYVIRCFEEIKRQVEKSKNREMLEKQIYVRFAYVIVATAISGYFNPSNDLSFRIRCETFFKYISNDFTSKTLSIVDGSDLDVFRRIVYCLIKKKRYFAIQTIAYIRAWQKNR